MIKASTYFVQFIVIVFLFLIFKILGLKISSHLGGKLGKFFGPFFRSKKLIRSNISMSLPHLSTEKITEIEKDMWNNYGRILAEYMYIKYFRQLKNNHKIIIDGKNILDEVKKNNEPVIFVSGHFNNFELMAMEIEKSGIELAAVYRPLNNFFINKIMERIRKKYICKNQIKKGISGVKDLLLSFKKGSSIALMIDQRVSEGIKSEFFGKMALTTTMPAQFVRKFNCKIIPVYIERIKETNFIIKFHEPIMYDKSASIEYITRDLNSHLEKMIVKNPSQWIWSHNRWK